MRSARWSLHRSSFFGRSPTREASVFDKIFDNYIAVIMAVAVG
jgi:hypothetical protein